MNKTRTVLAGVAAIAAAAAIGACSNSATKDAAPSPAPATSQSSATAQATAHNHADVMFAHMMIPHHQQAVEMSDMILAKQGIDPRVVDLAKQIKAAQGPEIDTMQGWLNQWGMSGTTSMAPSDHGSMHGSGTTAMPMPGMGDGDMPAMDGMMSPADMQALQTAQGVDASKLYLAQMITHHQGAITMAQNEVKDGQFADAIALAKSIATSQQKEIDTMNQILATL